MEIATRCNENTIENFVCNIDDLSILFDELSPAVIEFFENGFIRTERTKKVKNCSWALKHKRMVFPGNTSIINEQIADDIVSKKFASKDHLCLK